MRRVLQIVPTLGFGGVAQFLLNYYGRMDHRKIIFDFITHGGAEDFHDELISKGSKIYYIKKEHECGFLEYAKQLRQCIRSEHYDIIHIHTGHVTGFTALLCRMFFSGKIFCHAHTTKSVNPKHEKLMPLFRIMARCFGDKLLGCGVDACKFCFGKNSKYTVVHNAISLDRFWNVDVHELDLLRHNFNINCKDFVIGHVGAFVTPKNHHFIIDIFNFVCKKYPNALLVLVGDGPLRSEIEEKCKGLGIYERVRFVGVQKNIPAFLHLFDAFILPSLYEGLPVCAVEAQSVVKNVCISNTIDKDVDAGVGNLTFLPIDNNSYELWENEIFKTKSSIDKKIVEEQYKKTGFEINESVKLFQKLFLS